MRRRTLSKWGGGIFLRDKQDLQEDIPPLSEDESEQQNKNGEMKTDGDVEDLDEKDGDEKRRKTSAAEDRTTAPSGGAAAGGHKSDDVVNKGVAFQKSVKVAKKAKIPNLGVGPASFADWHNPYLMQDAMHDIRLQSYGAAAWKLDESILSRVSKGKIPPSHID